MTATTPGVARTYETIFIAPPTLAETELDKLVDEVKDTFASKGATVTLVEKWGRRKLAYRIKRHQEGWYVLLQVSGSGDALSEAERRMRINENVLRYLTVRLDGVPGAVEASAQRQVRRAKLEEERAARAAEVARRPRPAEGGREDDDEESFED